MSPLITSGDEGGRVDEKSAEVTESSTDVFNVAVVAGVVFTQTILEPAKP